MCIIYNSNYIFKLFASIYNIVLAKPCGYENLAKICPNFQKKNFIITVYLYLLNL